MQSSASQFVNDAAASYERTYRTTATPSGRFTVLLDPVGNTDDAHTVNTQFVGLRVGGPCVWLIMHWWCPVCLSVMVVG